MIQCRITYCKFLQNYAVSTTCTFELFWFNLYQGSPSSIQSYQRSRICLYFVAKPFSCTLVYTELYTLHMHFINRKEMFAPSVSIQLSLPLLIWRIPFVIQKGALYLHQTRWQCVLSGQKFQKQLAQVKSFQKLAQHHTAVQGFSNFNV